MATELLFRDDAYLRNCDATVLSVNERGGIVLDRTVFYAASGGQPGDGGRLIGADGGAISVATTVTGETKDEIVHVAASPERLPEPGSLWRAEIDWDRRYRHMRMHTALHLLCALVRFPVTGGSIGAQDGRLDFDITESDAVDRDDLSERLNALVRADHPVATRWISEAELDPALVRTMAVQPPKGSGRIRLVSIGENDAVDLQPCGGTHVASTAEVGPLAVGKIEKKGRQNRRIRIRFAEET